MVVVLSFAATASAHDLERTQVTLTFARDGSFVLTVSNDSNWLALRLRTFSGSFADRVVIWVDGEEVRPTSVEHIRGPELDTYRMRGHMPLSASKMRWYYGLVIDPYPLTIRRADGRIVVEEVQGTSWSRTIDIGRQFDAPRVTTTAASLIVAGLFLIPLAIRLAGPRTARPAATPTEDGVSRGTSHHLARESPAPAAHVTVEPRTSTFE